MLFYASVWDAHEFSLNLHWVITLLGLGVELRKTRGTFHRSMNQTAILSYRDIQSEEVKRHLLRLLENPKDFSKSGRECANHSYYLIYC